MNIPPGYSRNRPTDEGYSLGHHLARFADAEEARLRAAGKPYPKRCDTCAFRKGTFPNGCVPTIMEALKCAMEQTPAFKCHENQQPDALYTCGGYLLLKAKTPGLKTPWKFSDQYSADEVTELESAQHSTNTTHD